MDGVTTPSSRSTARPAAATSLAGVERLATLIVAVPESARLRVDRDIEPHDGFPGQGMTDRRLGRGRVPAVDRLLAVDHQHRCVVQPVIGVLGPGVDLVVRHLPLAVQRVGNTSFHGSLK